MSFVAVPPTSVALKNRGGIASTSQTMPVRPAAMLRRTRVVMSATKIEINKAPPSPIQLTDAALKHLAKLRKERGEEKTVLRVGVKSGGCRSVTPSGVVLRLLPLPTPIASRLHFKLTTVEFPNCSGMSYVMDFVSSPEDMKPDDTVVPFGDGQVELRIDPKSLLYLFGLTLDHSDELIGGGYKFVNPNAASSCGCGTSFTV